MSFDLRTSKNKTHINIDARIKANWTSNEKKQKNQKKNKKVKIIIVKFDIDQEACIQIMTFRLELLLLKKKRVLILLDYAWKKTNDDKRAK